MNAGVWGGLSVALDLTSFIPFIWAGLAGRARPSRVSWSIWAAEYWVLFLSEVTYGSGLASVWIASGEAAGSTTLAAIGWLHYLASQSRPRLRAGRPGDHDRLWDRWRQPVGTADDDPPQWLTLPMTVGVIAALSAWEFTSRFTAIMLAVTVDMMAASVNACKTYRHPAGESMLSWWLFLAATVAALMAVGHAAPILYAYPGAGALTAITVIAAWAAGHRRNHPQVTPAGRSRPAPRATP